MKSIIQVSRAVHAGMEALLNLTRVKLFFLTKKCRSTGCRVCRVNTRKARSSHTVLLWSGDFGK